VLIYKASKLADGADVEDPEDDTDEEDKEEETSKAYVALMKLARAQRRAGESVAQSFARQFTDPANAALVRADKAAHVQKVNKVLGY
jgi:hypothetical protein